MAVLICKHRRRQNNSIDVDNGKVKTPVALKEACEQALWLGPDTAKKKCREKRKIARLQATLKAVAEKVKN